jgi:hypothetical protein
MVQDWQMQWAKLLLQKLCNSIKRLVILNESSIQNDISCIGDDKYSDFGPNKQVAAP